MTPRIFDIKLTEHEIQNEIIKLLKIKGIFGVRLNSGMFKSGQRFIRCYTLPDGTSKGMPDIMCLTKTGGIFFIECKAAHGKLSPEQSAFIEIMNNYNIKVIVANNWIEILNYVESII